MSAVAKMADDGLRVLGVAKAISKIVAGLPENQHDFEFSFIGLVGLADPIRPSVPAAIRECYTAGIRVVMITGDYSGTAQNIARQIGLKPSDMVITGPELAVMDDAELRQRVHTCSIFARMIPDQKLKLVEALKAEGEIVAMTGDGVNDAPALKAANIGVAMGARGTDVAREAASLVLLDDDFSSIVSAVKQGRRIYDNLKKAMAYIFAVHVPIAGLSLVPVLFKLPLVLMPMHIAVLELIIDPSCSVVFEMEDEEVGVMTRPPRNPRRPLFSRRLMGLGLMQGTSVFIAVLAVFLVSMLVLKYQEDEVRALSFAALVLSNLGLILTNKSWSESTWVSLRRRNPALLWVVIGSPTFLGLSLYVPVMSRLFHFGRLHLADLLIAVGAALLSTLWFEIAKLYLRRKKSNLNSI
jgi:Ca2+-transporting ATPase